MARPDSLEQLPTRTRLTAKKRRESILQAAVKVFVDRSYRGATTAEIASAADCNEALIFRHFGSKTGLFVETLELATVLICHEADTGAAPGGRGLPALRALAHYKGQDANGPYRDLARLRFVAAGETADPEIAAALRRHLDALHEWTAARLREAREDVALADDIDLELAAWEWSGIVTMTSLRLCGADQGAPAEFERMAAALISAWSR
jgi:AcrR family transcriptional regulator